MSTDLSSTSLENFSFEDSSKKSENGLLAIGEEINGYKVTERMVTDSGESEIYFCEKKDKKYILKYYYSYTMISAMQEKLKSIDHPNVLKIFDSGKYKKHFYEIDEYCPGGALSENLPLSEENALSIIFQINEGLKAFHTAGILHRDIKAENIYFTDSSKTKIVIGDFGICTLFDQKDNVNEHLTKIDAGTDGYKAPESFNGVVSPAIDYYSLGITIWHIATGKEPFFDENEDALSSGEIRLKTIEGTVADYLLAAAPKISLKLKTLILGLLVYRHDQRWRYEEVSKFLEGKEVLVFEEKRELESKFFFDGDELASLKSIAEKLLEKKDKAIQMLKGTDLVRCLDRNGYGDIKKGALTGKIEKIVEEYIAETAGDFNIPKVLGGFSCVEDKQKYGLQKIAYTLCKELAFEVEYGQQKFSILSLRDFTDLLINHSIVITPYLKYECKGLYLKLEALVAKNDDGTSDFSNFVRDIKTFVLNSKNDRILCALLYLNLVDNKIKPFTDKFSQNIELRTKEDVENLDDHLKNRLMYFINEKNSMVVAWFETVYKCKMSDWYDELEGGPSKNQAIANLRRTKIAAFGQWRYFELFLNGKDVIKRPFFMDKGKYGLLNFDGSVLIPANFDNIRSVFIRNQFIVKNQDKWVVYQSTENNFEAILSYSGEISVFDERFQYYIGSTKEENPKSIIIAKKDSSSENDYSLVELPNKPSLAKVTPLSEIEKPYSRFINEQAGCYELLDEQFKTLCVGQNIAAVPGVNKIAKELEFWIAENDRVKKISRDCKILDKYDYSFFGSINDEVFLVTTLEGINNIVTPNNEIIIENIDDFKCIESLAAIKIHHKKNWKLVNLKDKNWQFNGKKFKKADFFNDALIVSNSKKRYTIFNVINGNIVTTDIKVRGKGGILSNSLGYSDKFEALNLNTLYEACSKRDKNKEYNNIIGFNGSEFIQYSVSSGKAYHIGKYRYIGDNEIYDLIENVNPKKIISRVKYLTLHNRYKESNELINCTAYFFIEKGLHEVGRKLYSFVRLDRLDGFFFSYLGLKAFVAESYLKEEIKGKANKVLKFKARNRAIALYYCLTAFGKEFDNNGNIIQAPYFEKIKDQWDFQTALSAIYYLIVIANDMDTYTLKYLDYAVTKDGLISQVQDFLEDLSKSIVEEQNISSETYKYLHTIGEEYEYLNKGSKAMQMYELGIKYEPSYSFTNMYDAMRMQYNEKYYKQAYEYCKVLMKNMPNIMSDQKFTKIFSECKSTLGL